MRATFNLQTQHQRPPNTQLSKTNGTLYSCATPIGNLEDTSQRLKKILSQVSLIAAEDTRRAKVLLHHLDVRKPIIRLDAHTERKQSARIIKALQSGDDVALLSDAGSPNLSDPGARLLDAIYQAKLKASPIPGPSAITSLLSVSGLPGETFIFLGFLPRKQGDRQKKLATSASTGFPIIFFESPRRILATLQEINQNFDIQTCCLGKELTKTHERIWTGSLDSILQELETTAKSELGEWTAIIQFAKPDTDHSDAIELLVRQNLSKDQTLAIGTQLLGIPKNLLYKEILKQKHNS